jgi:hypothetical protein
MKGEGKHYSTWRDCAVCHEEFYARTATICRECQHRIKEKASNAEYEKLVEKGGVTQL